MIFEFRKNLFAIKNNLTQHCTTLVMSEQFKATLLKHRIVIFVFIYSLKIKIGTKHVQLHNDI